MRSIYTIVVIVVMACLLITAEMGGGSLTTVAWAEEAWKEKLMALCAKTDMAMNLSPQELKELIAGCERLQPVIDGLAESPRKVYGKRLKMCRDLFVYVLQSKETTAK